MVSNSAKLDRRTKQHTQYGVFASNGSRDMALRKSWQKKRKKKNNRFSVALYATEERSPEDEKLYAGQNRGKKKKKNNEANWMVSNSAKLNRKTKQHT